MQDSTTFTDVSHAPQVAVLSRDTPRTPRVELTGIVAQADKIIVALSDGRFNWAVTCKPADVQNFGRFQTVACQQASIWIDHWSQDASRAGLRRGDWNEAVTAAFARGEGAK